MTEQMTPSGLANAVTTAAQKAGIMGLGISMLDRGELNDIAVGQADVENGRPVSEATAFRVGCCVKLLTASLVMMLRDEGHFKLDDQASELIGETDDLRASLRGVTVLDLLRHTHGIDVADTNAQIDQSRLDQHNALDHASLKASLEKSQRLFAPGAHYSYSSFGYRLLGLIAERATGTDFATLLAERIFRPLGILAVLPGRQDSGSADIATAYRRGRQRPSRLSYIDRYTQGICPARGGGLAMSPTNFMKFILVHVRTMDHAIPGLSAAAIREMRESIFVRDYMKEQFEGSGISWRKINSAAIGMAGLGFGHHCILRAIPSADTAIVLMSNTSPAWPVYNEAFADPQFQNNLESGKRRAKARKVAAGIDNRSPAVFGNDLGRITITPSTDGLVGTVQIRFAHGLRQVLEAPLKPASRTGFAFSFAPVGINLRQCFWFTENESWSSAKGLWDGLYYWKRIVS